ncbi:MAG: nucleoside triphosphate pyrophosphohydrolase [Candidatus Roizmanbacteria bacterium]|nr:nucleoside triphosphate pyrophosphohydrolase [Candidatus Roizmanbacteria bacterium]
MKKINKLVRDKIPSLIESEGRRTITRIYNDDEFIDAAKQKLVEEMNEYIESGNLEELADLVEVANAIGGDELNKARKEKNDKNGDFSTHTCLISIDSDT